MANYLTTDTELTSIANAIRTKGGTNSNLTFPTGFVSAINDISTGGGGGTITLSGNCNYALYGDFGEYILQNFTVATSDIIQGQYMFEYSTRSTIPFALNFATSTLARISFEYMFYYCQYLTTLPTINIINGMMDRNCGFSQMFNYCNALETVPDFLGNNVDLTDFYTSTQNRFSNMFSNCYNLKTISSDLLGKL